MNLRMNVAFLLNRNPDTSGTKACHHQISLLKVNQALTWDLKSIHCISINDVLFY